MVSGRGCLGLKNRQKIQLLNVVETQLQSPIPLNVSVSLALTFDSFLVNVPLRITTSAEIVTVLAEFFIGC
jgi:hypothetical protein